MRCDAWLPPFVTAPCPLPRLVRKLAAYPRQNQVARALTELGKLERTAFLLEYFRDESLRRRILIGLNKGEALHALARQLFFGRLGELRDRALEDQMHRASCLHLLMAAIAAWNTIYLTEAYATLRRHGEEISETTLAHIAPLGWEHINLIGNYHSCSRSNCQEIGLFRRLADSSNQLRASRWRFLS
jgi:hypothetical protein